MTKEEKEQEAVMLLHAIDGKFGKDIDLEISKEGVEEFKELYGNINLNVKENGK